MPTELPKLKRIGQTILEIPTDNEAERILHAASAVHVVQKMAGRTNLSTTQRYVHFLKGDLEDAARRLAGVGNILETPASASKRPAA